MALLAGKTAVITGGSSGIGLATARRFIDEGATVFITGRKAAELETAAAELGPAAVPVQGDVTVPADLHRLRDIAAKSAAGSTSCSPTRAPQAQRLSVRSPTSISTCCSAP